MTICSICVLATPSKFNESRLGTNMCPRAIHRNRDGWMEQGSNSHLREVQTPFHACCNCHSRKSIRSNRQYLLCDLRSIYIEEFARHRQFLVLTSWVNISKRNLKVTRNKADGADIGGFGVEIDADSEYRDDISGHEEDSESSSDKDDGVPSEVFDNNLFRDEEQHDWEGPSNKRVEKRKARATITVFDTQSCTRLFRLRRPIKCRLFASPPVFHPTKSLVVWPLADGDVLFLDYLAKTYFTRRLQPSTPHSKSDKSWSNRC